jgi:ribosomal protein S16
MLKLKFVNKNNKQNVIRFRKKGIIRYPLYDVIVTYKNLRNKSIALEKLGFFNPQYGVKSLYVNIYRLSY